MDGYGSVHEPPVIPSIVVQGFRCATGWIVAEEPHVRSIRIELCLDMRGEVVASIDDHPDLCGAQPISYDEVLEVSTLE